MLKIHVNLRNKIDTSPYESSKRKKEGEFGDDAAEFETREKLTKHHKKYRPSSQKNLKGAEEIQRDS